MKFIELKARAKINLSLDVLRKRDDGYHDLRMIMQTLELHDSVAVRAEGSTVAISCNSPFVPSDERNIAYKAAKILVDNYNINTGVKIVINKIIPVAAGLAGGSSNAAAVLKGMNELFNLEINEGELAAIGKSIGADVPYCLAGGTMLAEGIGDKLTRLRLLQGVDILLVKPKIGVSTAWVYGNLDLSAVDKRPDTELLLKLIDSADARSIAANMRNVLENVTEKKYGIIGEIKSKVLSLGAAGSMMSGSGPTVFGVFEDRENARNAYEVFKKDPRWETILTYTI